VGKDRVKIIGDWSAWAEPVRQGRLIRPDGEAIWVLIRTRPDLLVDDDGFALLKQEGRVMGRIDHPSVMRLLHVTRVDGSVAWVYEGAQAVSVARALDVANTRGEFFPAKAAIEIVGRALQGIRAALTQGDGIQGPGTCVLHLGAAPSEILIDAVGAVRVAGFSLAKDQLVQQTAPTGYAPAHPGTPDQRAAYGMGALLVHLLGGERPAEAGVEAPRQDAVIRRAMIRVLARPGEAVPEALTELIRSALSFDPEERPELSAIEDALFSAAQQLRSAGLRTWATTTIPNLLTQQEQGFPDPDTARMRRHIDPSEDSSSFAPPPVRKRAPREVATMVGRPSVNPKTLQPYEADPNESTPYLGGQSLDSVPTSETDVANLEVTNIGQPLPEPILNVHIDQDEDTWEVELQEEAGPIRFRPLLWGLVCGLVLAVGVGQYVVEPMVVDSRVGVAQPIPPAPATNLPEATTKTAAEELAEEALDTGEAPAGTAEDDVDDAADDTAEAAAEDAAEDAAETAAEDTKEASEDAKEPAPPASAEPPPPRPKRKAPSTKPKAEPPVPTEFTVTFRSGDPAVERMVVRCHKGGTAEGTSVVHIVRAGKGPCKVEGYRGGVKHSVSAVLTGPKNYTCFKDGARRCD